MKNILFSIKLSQCHQKMETYSFFLHLSSTQILYDKVYGIRHPQVIRHPFQTQICYVLLHIEKNTRQDMYYFISEKTQDKITQKDTKTQKNNDWTPQYTKLPWSLLHLKGWYFTLGCYGCWNGEANET